ncbi:class I SAM-dependent methyltransferase, partial [bacterium]|nr:class I SAM-dependent methyltransferase [bacterium]
MKSSRKKQILRQADKLAESRDHWIEKNSFFYKNDHSYMQFLVGDGKRVLELGCGTGQLLNALNPSYGIGVDLSANMISVAQQNHPSLEFIQGDLEDEDFISSLQGPFDFIILSD